MKKTFKIEKLHRLSVKACVAAIASVTLDDIQVSLSNQQVYWMTKRGRDAIVSDKQIRRYARACYRLFKLHLKACATPKEQARLYSAFRRRMQPRRPEFKFALAA